MILDDHGFRLFFCFAAKKHKADRCILKKRLKMQENEKGEKNHAETPAAAHPYRIVGDCLYPAAKNCAGLTAVRAKKGEDHQ